MPPKTKKKRSPKPLQGFSIRVTNNGTQEASSETVYRKTGTKVSTVLNAAVRGAKRAK